MEQIVKIEEKDGKLLVSARELHLFLESKQDFSTWIKARIDKYDLIEDVDYVTAPQIYGTVNGGTSTRTEYGLTVSCAKELSMVENNDKGKEARQYFIKCENKLKEVYTKFKSLDVIIKKQTSLGKLLDNILRMQKSGLLKDGAVLQAAHKACLDCGISG